MEFIIIDASLITSLANHPFYFLFLELVKKFDTDKIDILIEELTENIDKGLDEFFSISSKIYYYLSVLVNTVKPDNLGFKVVKHYITNTEVKLRIEVKEL